MKLSQSIFKTVVPFVFSIRATSAVADMMRNESVYLISKAEVHGVVQRSECCDGGFWQLLALASQYSGLAAKNYGCCLLHRVIPNKYV